MVVKMNVYSVLSQLNSMNKYLTDVRMKSVTLDSAFQSFQGEGGLESAAYNNHKSYVGQIHHPAAAGIANFCSEMTEANQEYGNCICQYFSEGMVVDEDKWRSEYEALKVQYDQLNSCLSFIMETIRSILGNGRPSSVHMDISGYQHIANSYREELDTLYEIIEEYRRNIEKIGEMLAATSGIYAGAQTMQKALASAVSAMQGVRYNAASNQYAIAPVNLQLFADIEGTWQTVLISKELRKRLGDELLEEEEFMALDAKEQLEYADKIARIIGKYIPNLSVQLLDGEMEIPLADGLVLYGGVEKSIETNLDNPQSVEVAISKNREILAEWGVKIGNLEGKVDREGAGGKVSYAIDDNTTAYTQITRSNEAVSIKIEWGATTTYEEMNYVTSKVGLGYRPTNSDSKMEAYKLEPANSPRPPFEIAGVLLPFPSGVPVPIG